MAIKRDKAPEETQGTITTSTTPATTPGEKAKRGPKPGSTRGPVMRWNEDKEAAMVATALDLQGGTAPLTVNVLTQALASDPLFKDDVDKGLLKPASVQVAYNRVRKVWENTEPGYVPDLDTNRKRVVNVEALKSLIAQRRQAA